jgi:hypothetical protein
MNNPQQQYRLDQDMVEYMRRLREALKRAVEILEDLEEARSLDLRDQIAELRNVIDDKEA